MRPDEVAATHSPRFRASVAGVELDGEAVLYDEEQDMLHLLNPTATVVWSCLDGQTTLAELADDLADAFEMPVDVVTGELLQLVRQFGQQGLLEGVVPDEDVAANSGEAETP